MEVDECKIAEELLEAEKGVSSQTTIATAQVKIKKVKAPRKLVEDKARAIGQIGQVVWKTYLPALGHGTGLYLDSSSFLPACLLLLRMGRLSMYFSC